MTVADVLISMGSRNLPFGLNGAAVAMMVLAALLVYKLKTGGRGGVQV